jgi:hypothetical protein
MVESDPTCEAWPATSASDRLSPASSVTATTPAVARRVSSRSFGTEALNPSMMSRWRRTVPPTAATACSGTSPVPGVSRTTTWTFAADDGVAASAATGPITPTPTAAATATVASRRACMGRPPHVTPKESGAPGLRSRSLAHILVLLTVGTAMSVAMCSDLIRHAV